MRIYVIGPVTGRKDRNRAAFERARRRLEAEGHEVSTPLDFVPEDATHAMAMRMSLCWMLHTGRVEGVALLDGWQGSLGATVERVVAMSCRIPYGTVDDIVSYDQIGLGDWHASTITCEPPDSLEQFERDCDAISEAEGDEASLYAALADYCSRRGLLGDDHISLVARDLARRARALEGA